MRLAVVGSRSFTDEELLTTVLDKLDSESIVTGGAKGADTLAEKWAKAHGIPVTVHRPNWIQHGPGAAIRRNSTIVADCDRLVAFWDGRSRGTLDSISKALRAGKVVFFVICPRGVEP